MTRAAPARGKGRILLIDDDNLWQTYLQDCFRHSGYDVLMARDGPTGIGLTDEHTPDLILLDIKMPDQDGVEILRQLKTRHADIEVIMVTAVETPDVVVACIKAGAYDFLSKQPSSEIILATVERAMEKIRLASANAVLIGEKLAEPLLGSSPVMEKIRDQIRGAAETNAPVLITGETGTGKELVARAIGATSPRRTNPFVTVDCTTLGRELMESELFGHERGAFTGAYQTKKGRLEMANGGTVLLDEVGELEPALQAKLLRVVERGEYQRVGGVTPLRCDIRVMAATHRNLEAEIHRGGFRSDLFYRLNVLSITLPPLRDRPDDIPLLTDHFIRLFSNQMRKRILGIDDDLRAMFEQYHWPGNIRELQNTIQRMVIFERGEYLTMRTLPLELQQAAQYAGSHANSISTESQADLLPLREATKRFKATHIQEALQRANGKSEHAARILHVSRSHFYHLLEEYAIEPRRVFQNRSRID